MPETILYRNDEDGTGERNLRSMLVFEICELGNEQLVDALCNFDLSKNALTALEKARTYVGKGMDEKDAVHSIEKAVSLALYDIAKSVGHPLHYGLWLEEKDVIQKLYQGTEENIDAYPVSDVCLIDLGGDGKLFAYEFLPEPIQEESSAPTMN